MRYLVTLLILSFVVLSSGCESDERGFNSGGSDIKNNPQDLYKHSITLEVSIPDLILSLSDYSENPTFRNALSAAREAQPMSSDGFMVRFDKAWRAQTSDQEEDDDYDKLWRIFYTFEQKDLFPAKSTDDEILAILVNETEKAIDASENIIRQRIHQLGVALPNVQKLENGRILVEFIGIDDIERARKQLKSTANLEFWETYFNDEVIGKLSEANTAIGKSQSNVLEDLQTLSHSVILVL